MRVTEETLEQEIATILGVIFGGDIITQAKSGGKKPDIVIKIEDYKIVLELKIGGSIKFIEAVTQGFDYAQSLDANGIIALIYPDSARRTVSNRQDVQDIVENTPVSALVISPFLNRHFPSVTLREFADKLYSAFKSKVTTVDVGLVTNVLRDAVELLSLQLRRQHLVSRPALDIVINRFELFQVLSSESKSKDTSMARDLNAVACDLAAYVLVNQILLYHLLTKPLGLPPLTYLNSLDELKSNFEKVTDIDYKAVYHVDVSSQLANSTLASINKIVLAIRSIQSENVPHDLLGRLFHEFLPIETRKQLATFYTRPVAAEILATIAIQEPKGVVIDVACGSGTLLVSAYRRKKKLSPTLTHRDLIEKEIYGIDIMPFAAHLAALNLTLQNLNEITDIVHIGVGNALVLETGSTLHGQYQLFPVVRKHANVDLEVATDFQLPNSVQLVIMNPPFTDRKRLKEGMLGGQADAFSKSQNYWAYFIKLADGILSDTGRVAAVFPRLFLAGSNSREIREWLFKDGNYTLRYIVRTCRETAFSEAAHFRDYLIVMNKGKQNDHCGVVYLKASLREITLDEARDIAERINSVKQGSDHNDNDIQVTWVNQKVVRANWNNLGSLVSFEDADNGKVLTEFLQTFTDKSQNNLTCLGNIPFVSVKRGFEPRPPGLYDLVFAVRSTNDKRIGHSNLILNYENTETITASLRGAKQSIKIPRGSVIAGIKTASYLGFWKIDENADWIITDRFRGFRKSIEIRTGKTVDFHYIREFTGARLAHLIVTKRVNLAAPGTCSLAFYSDKKIASTNVLYSVITDPEYSKGLCLWLNSALGVLQYLTSRMETEGAFCDMLQETLIDEVLVPTREIIERHKTNIDKIMDKYGRVELPSLLEQFSNPPDARKKLDQAMLKLFGWSENEIEEWLPKVYKAISSELRFLADSTRKSNNNENDGQEPLF